MTFSLIFFITVLWILIPFLGVDSSQPESRSRPTVGNNSVVCILESREFIVDPFEFSLCTHATIPSPAILCEKETCTFQNDSGTEKAIRWAGPHYRGNFGMFCNFRKFMDGFLSSDLRRKNTVKEYEKFMIKNGLNFLVFQENGLGIQAPKTTSTNLFKFLEDLAKSLHDQGLHIGLRIPIYKTSFSAIYDIEKLTKFIDWFQIAPHYHNMTGYIVPLLPLSSPYERMPSTTKYWIEHALQWIKPECLVLDLGPWANKFTAESTVVEPGPGSKAKNVQDFLKSSDICYQLLVDNTCREYWDSESSTPWAACGNDVYTYDNSRSLKLKVDLALQYNITRIVIWGNDFGHDNICGDGDPLVFLRAVQGIRNATSEDIS